MCWVRLSVRHLLTILGWRLGKASRYRRVVCLRVCYKLLGGVGGVVAFNGDVSAVSVFLLWKKIRLPGHILEKEVCWASFVYLFWNQIHGRCAGGPLIHQQNLDSFPKWCCFRTNYYALCHLDQGTLYVVLARNYLVCFCHSVSLRLFSNSAVFTCSIPFVGYCTSWIVRELNGGALLQ